MTRRLIFRCASRIAGPLDRTTDEEGVGVLRLVDARHLGAIFQNDLARLLRVHGRGIASTSAAANSVCMEVPLTYATDAGSWHL
jgi:hypothetical protein